jgi:general secretion pathway protein J
VVRRSAEGPGRDRRHDVVRDLDGDLDGDVDRAEDDHRHRSEVALSAQKATRRCAARRRPRGAERGMTLLEILVSIGILALVSTLIYGAFDGMQRTQSGIARLDERYHQGRQALARMSRELQSAFLSFQQPQFLTASARNFVFLGTDGGNSDRVDFQSFSHQRLLRNAHESDQNELSYFLGRDPERPEKYDLLHREQKEVDLDPTKGGVVSVLCEDVLVFDAQYLEPLNDLWLDTWDSSQAASQYTYNRLPLQVRLKLTLRGGVGDQPIKLMTKVSLGLQSPLTFGLSKSQIVQAQAQQSQRTPH